MGDPLTGAPQGTTGADGKVSLKVGAAGKHQVLVRMAGYRIAGKEQLEEDKVLVGIQAVAGGVVAKVALRRFGNEWKFNGVE